MLIDNLFHSERHAVRRIALLATVPCAILPVMMACAGWMSLPFEPMLFRGDWLLWMLIYGFYLAGLYLSWRHHRKWIPFLVFLLHGIGLGIYLFDGQPEWAGYAAILGVMATSLVNQYFRVGSVTCVDCLTDGESCTVSSASPPDQSVRH